MPSQAVRLIELAQAQLKRNFSWGESLPFPTDNFIEIESKEAKQFTLCFTLTSTRMVRLYSLMLS